MSETGPVVEPLAQKTEIPKVVRIGTDNFVDYLSDVKKTPDGLLRGDVDDFEKQIEVPEEIHQTIKEMYESKRESAGIGPVAEERRKKYAQEMDKVLPGTGSDMLTNVYVTKYDEQARVVYRDDKNSILSTGENFGHGQEVNIGISLQEAINKGTSPLVAI